MTKNVSSFRHLVLLFSGLLVCACQQGQAPYAASPPDLSDPAADVTYGVGEIPPTDYIRCWDHKNRLQVRPLGDDYLVNNEKMDDRQLSSYVTEYVLNPQRLPYYADSRNRAIIRLVDMHVGKIAWRNCAIESIRTAYYQLWDDAAISNYGKSYILLTHNQKECILDDYPLSIDLAGPWIIPPPPPPPPPADWEG